MPTTTDIFKYQYWYWTPLLSNRTGTRKKKTKNGQRHTIFFSSAVLCEWTSITLAPFFSEWFRIRKFLLFLLLMRSNCHAIDNFAISIITQMCAACVRMCVHIETSPFNKRCIMIRILCIYTIFAKCVLLPLLLAGYVRLAGYAFVSLLNCTNAQFISITNTHLRIQLNCYLDSQWLYRRKALDQLNTIFFLCFVFCRRPICLY